MTERSPRRWFRFGLRTMLIVVTAVCCYLGWETSIVRQRKAVLQELRDKGGAYIVTAQMAQPAPGGGSAGQAVATVPWCAACWETKPSKKSG